MKLTAQSKKQKSGNVWSSWIELDSGLRIVLFNIMNNICNLWVR